MTFNHRAMDTLIMLEQRGLTNRDHVINAALVAFGRLPRMDQDEWLKQTHEPVVIIPSSEPVLGSADPGHVRVPTKQEPAPGAAPEAPAVPKKKNAPTGKGRWPKSVPTDGPSIIPDRGEQKLKILEDDDVDSIFGQVEK